MKKVVSIFAVAVMTMGLATIAIENNSELPDNSSMELSCDDCVSESDDREV